MRVTSVTDHMQAIQTLLQQPFSQTEFSMLQQKQQYAEQQNKILQELLQQLEHLQQEQQEQEAVWQQLQQKQQALHTEILLNDQQKAVLQDSIPQQLRNTQALMEYVQQLQQEHALAAAQGAKQEARLRQLEINLAQQQRDCEHAQIEEQQAQQALQAAELSWQAVAQNSIQEEEMQRLQQKNLQKREQQLQEYALKKEQPENKDTRIFSSAVKRFLKKIWRNCSRSRSSCSRRKSGDTYVYAYDIIMHRVIMRGSRPHSPAGAGSQRACLCGAVVPDFVRAMRTLAACKSETFAKASCR